MEGFVESMMCLFLKYFWLWVMLNMIDYGVSLYFCDFFLEGF